MSFPLSPTNGQQTVLNGITYTYGSVSNLWTRLPGSFTATTFLAISSSTQSTSTATGALVVSGGVGVGGSVNIGGTVTGGGIRSTSTSTPPASPTVGDIWYITGTDVIARFTNDGTTSAWVDITGPTIANSVIASSASGTAASGTGTTTTFVISNITNSTGTTSGALVVAGGVGISRDLNVGGNIIFTTGTSYIAFSVGTTAQRTAIVSTATGATRINSDTGYLEVYYNSIWNNTVINFSAGQTQANPATSAAAIKAQTGTTADGFYWINLPTVGSTYVYCDMNTNGGGWMLAAKVYNDTSKFNGYASTDWTTVSVFNAAQAPTYAGHIKTDVYNSWPAATGQRLSMGLVSNNLYEAWTGYSMYGLLNAASQNSQNSRAQWLAWQAAGGGTAATNFDAQPNCNQAGSNKSYSSFSIRIGITMNNEGDCNSNDSSMGFGSNFGPAGWYTWTPTASGLMTGWIWVK